VKQPNGLALKGQGVEEWLDVHFFRPVGIRLARRLFPTRVTPDQVTLVCLLIGLVAGHLMVYRAAVLNASGVALFVVSDVFDSADGQLARLRGTSTRFGRILDGVSDGTRFLNLYLHLMLRLLLAGAGVWVIGLVCLGGISNVLQSSTVDFIRHAFLEAGEGEGSELDLPEDRTAEPRAGFWRGLALRSYQDYVTRQAKMFAASVALIRRIRVEGSSEEFAAAYRRAQRPLIGWCPLIAQNFRFLLLLVTVVPGWPAGYFWVSLGPLNLAMAAIIQVHERNARALGAARATPVTAEVA
jgi:hypothetical protein